LPPPEALKRFAAARFVFILGMSVAFSLVELGTGVSADRAGGAEV
jgi:hypothetical protein